MQVNEYRLKALAVEQSEILLLPVDHQKTQADAHGTNHTALPGGEHVDTAQGEATLRHHRSPLSTLRPTIAPAALMGLNHRRNNPSHKSQFP